VGFGRPNLAPIPLKMELTMHILETIIEGLKAPVVAVEPRVFSNRDALIDLAVEAVMNSWTTWPDDARLGLIQVRDRTNSAAPSISSHRLRFDFDNYCVKLREAGKIEGRALLRQTGGTLWL
jgi:hypothetical protein